MSADGPVDEGNQQAIRHQGVRLRLSDEALIDTIEPWLRAHRAALPSGHRGLSIIVRAGLWILHRTITEGSADLAMSAFRYALSTTPKVSRPTLPRNRWLG